MPSSNMPLKYANTELPKVERDKISEVLNPIDSFERNANGDAFLQPITLKTSISVSWSRLTGSEANFVMNTLKRNRTGTLQYYSITDNSVVEKRVYWGTGPRIDYNRFDDNLERSLYSALAVNFIEL